MMESPLLWIHKELNRGMNLMESLREAWIHEDPEQVKSQSRIYVIFLLSYLDSSSILLNTICENMRHHFDSENKGRALKYPNNKKLQGCTESVSRFFWSSHFITLIIILSKAYAFNGCFEANQVSQLDKNWIKEVEETHNSSSCWHFGLKVKTDQVWIMRLFIWWRPPAVKVEPQDLR